MQDIKVILSNRILEILVLNRFYRAYIEITSSNLEFRSYPRKKYYKIGLIRERKI